MKEPNLAPAYACLYPGLCDVARKCGYALAIHGSVIHDLDLIAVPWIDDAESADTLIQQMKDLISAIHLESPDINANNSTNKPHGRVSWNLYLHHGAKVDVSVMPRKL